jgi:hypothetical protein
MRHHKSNKEGSRPILKHPTGNNRFIATTMTPYMLSKRNMILIICSMRPRRLEVTIGNNWAVGPCVGYGSIDGKYRGFRDWTSRGGILCHSYIV